MSIGKKLLILIFVFLILTFFLTLTSYYIARKNVIYKVESMGQTTVQEIALSFNEYFSKLSNITQSFGNTIKYFYMKNIKINYEDFIKAYYFSIYSHGVQRQITEASNAAEKVTLDSEQLATLVSKLQKLIEQFKLS
jgi:hypothetical protein